MSSFEFKNILCIRADNMGDILMSGPAMRALKRSFRARITLLTSRMGAPVIPFIPEIDQAIVADLPWSPTGAETGPGDYAELAGRLRDGGYDLAVIFTVYSQSPLPAALLCWQAGIPARAAWCRENPYALLTHWLPDAEPYRMIRHEVERQLELVRHLGAETEDCRLALRLEGHERGDAAASDVEAGLTERLYSQLAAMGIPYSGGWIVLHPGVSEARREYPEERWVLLVRELRRRTGLPLLVTGGPGDAEKADRLVRCAGEGVYSLAGRLGLGESIALIRDSRVLVCVNTVAAHIGAAVGVPLVVLYAMTNPQHTPWRAKAEIFPFAVGKADWSRNEIIRFVCEKENADALSYPTAAAITDAVLRLLAE